MIQLPEAFVERTKTLLADEFSAFEKALNETVPVCVRVNDKIVDLSPSDTKVKWCDDGFYFDERPIFTADPLLHAGAYYVQEASSMFLNQVVDVYMQNVNYVLDLCAAPGGKSTLLSQYLPKDSLLVSNEFVRSRAMILAENMTKWGNPNIVVTNNSPKDFERLHGFFDAVIVDAPCSGEGMFRKVPDAISEWSVQNVQQCVIRQKSIIEDVWDSLRNEGVFVYSTCTYNKEENEDNVEWICKTLGAEVLPIDISKFDGIIQTEFGYRFFPHKVKGEGFFISVMRKISENTVSEIKIKNNKKDNKLIDRHKEFSNQINNADDFEIKELNQKIIAFPKKYYFECLYLEKHFNCILNGVEIAEIKGKDIIPSHQLALSKIINIDAFDTVELNYEAAIAFLRKESININDEIPRGYILVTYQHLPLGWIKNLGNRANNLYPQHWRIRMSF
jgi:16S rRNA C967 or C1407 C5-methylase (RsmB/RsmF family)/NOL1/NOP2/fmu family ribosome biogenesis protein